jgi:hypothetical protein
MVKELATFHFLQYGESFRDITRVSDCSSQTEPVHGAMLVANAIPGPLYDHYIP